jgi:glycosyltransferase involved in cell wall biosynthesis
VVLVLKTNPGAAQVAATALADIRFHIPSEARIELRPEVWGEEQMAAFHQRGDCYVSLHRGEGWNCPLFEAAGRGKAIVATGFSGPTDYLDAAAHRLVRYRPATVRQRYAFYSPAMRWAEPEMEHAIEMLRAAYAERHRSERLTGAAERIRRNFSSEAIGESARQRLLRLLRRTNPAKSERLEGRGALPGDRGISHRDVAGIRI